MTSVGERPVAYIRHSAPVKVTEFLLRRVLRRTSLVRVMESIWIGAKPPGRRYNCAHNGCTEESGVDQPSIVYCGHCGAAVNLPSSFCGACGRPLQNPAPPAPAAQPQNPQPVYGSAPPGPAVQCPYCHSPQVQVGKRGWKWYAGYVGSGNVQMTCLTCGKTF
jgi:hypothetical protein